MSEFSTSDSKKILFDTVKPYFKEEGYKFISGGSPGFIKAMEFGYIDIFFTFSSHASMGLVGFNPIRCYLKEVEVIMDEISYPEREILKIGEGMWRVATIKDTKTKLFQSNKTNPVNTREKTIEFTKEIVNYMQNEGAEFIKKYTVLPNVLTEIDNLRKENKLMNLIVSGSTEYFFRVLVIAKLCNDKNIDDKFEEVESLLSSKDHYLKWIPYYEKLKAKLANLEPRYNL